MSVDLRSERGILACWDAQLTAMDAGDADALSRCFTPDAVLVHMTGYVQPLDEWMDGVRTREFVYHRVERRSVQVTDADAISGRLVGRVITGITDDGTGQAWPLRMEQAYALVGDSWLCTESRVTFDRG